MKTKMLMAGLALFAFTSIGFAKDAPKKAECATKTECGQEKKACCGDAAKAEKAPEAKKATATAKKADKPVAKK